MLIFVSEVIFDQLSAVTKNDICLSVFLHYLPYLRQIPRQFLFSSSQDSIHQTI